MSSIGTGYDLSSTTFSPDGRVFQVEYAGKAVENSGTVLGVKCVDGVVLAVEKMVISKMLVPGSTRRSHIVDANIALSICGLVSDGRVLVSRARKEAEQYKDFYGHDIPGAVLASRLADFVHLYTLHWQVRPFGCAVLLAVNNPGEDPQLYLIEPSGVSYRYYACAFGKGRQAAKTDLEKINLKTITCDQAVQELAKIIVAVHDDAKDKDYELEMIWVKDNPKSSKDKPLPTAQAVPKDIIHAAHSAAKAAAENDDDMDDE
jgi:20S proteasome subunit alpha 7